MPSPGTQIWCWWCADHVLCAASSSSNGSVFISKASSCIGKAMDKPWLTFCLVISFWWKDQWKLWKTTSPQMTVDLSISCESAFHVNRLWKGCEKVNCLEFLMISNGSNIYWDKITFKKSLQTGSLKCFQPSNNGTSVRRHLTWQLITRRAMAAPSPGSPQRWRSRRGHQGLLYGCFQK